MADDDDEFGRLMERVRANDEDAVAELVKRYEPEVRAIVRTWLRPWENRFRKVFDSTDICQSVLAWFFLNGAGERYDLSRPDHLRKLLRVVVRNRVIYHVRRHDKDRRVGEMVKEIASRELPPDDAAAGRELMAAIADRLTTEEMELAQYRLEGRSWGEIAAAVGGSADARRMQLARAADRLARELSSRE